MNTSGVKVNRRVAAQARLAPYIDELEAKLRKSFPEANLEFEQSYQSPSRFYLVVYADVESEFDIFDLLGARVDEIAQKERLRLHILPVRHRKLTEPGTAIGIAGGVAVTGAEIRQAADLVRAARGAQENAL